MSGRDLTSASNGARGRRRPVARPVARPGMVYLSVLIVAMIITVVGVSALFAVRIQRRAAEGAHVASATRTHARSAVELALQKIANDPDWRTTYTHDQWTEPVALGDAKVSFKLVDAADTDLSDDRTDRVWLHGRALIGQTRRVTRVCLMPKSELPNANLLQNPNGEWGTRHWWADHSDALLRQVTADAHGGVSALYAKARPYPWVGVNQGVTNDIENGRAYYLEAWVRLASNDAPFVIQLYTNDSVNGHDWTGATTQRIGATWTRISTTVTAQWDGTLNAAVWQVETAERTEPIYVDDAVMMPASHLHEMTPIPGTWSQVVQ